MAKITALPDIHHEWARNPGERWHCRHCPATTWIPMPGECPGREPVMPVSEVRALLEGLRGQMVGSAAAAQSGGHSDYHDGRAAAHEDDAAILTEALTTLTGSDR